MAKKDDKVYEEYEIEFKLTGNNRKDLRKKIVDAFLSEKPGYWKDGKKHVTRYKYFVERLQDGGRVYLYRPTFLNKGIDFQVWVEKYDGKNDKRPSHKDIFNDLKLKMDKEPSKVNELLETITEVYGCEEPSEVIKNHPNLKFEHGMSVELILKVLKWLFIEQDITYWNYDGRRMLFLEIKKRVRSK